MDSLINEGSSEDQGHKNLGLLSAGKVIGAHSIFERHHVRRATVTAVTGGRAAKLIWKKFQWFLSLYPEEGVCVQVG